MRQDKLTTKFQEAFSDAQSLALANDNGYIEPVHLLAAMLKQDDGPRAMLEKAGVNAAGLEISAQAAIKKLAQVQGQEQISVSSDLAKLLQATEKAIEAMIDEALKRFDIFGARVVHRVGLLQPLDQVVMVSVTSAHRAESFKACEFLMDYLKTQAPFWKKEQTPEGERWVDARVADDAALAKWGIQERNV